MINRKKVFEKLCRALEIVKDEPEAVKDPPVENPGDDVLPEEYTCIPFCEALRKLRPGSEPRRPVGPYQTVCAENLLFGDCRFWPCVCLRKVSDGNEWTPPKYVISCLNGDTTVKNLLTPQRIKLIEDDLCAWVRGAVRMGCLVRDPNDPKPIMPLKFIEKKPSFISPDLNPEVVAENGQRVRILDIMDGPDGEDNPCKVCLKNMLWAFTQILKDMAFHLSFDEDFGAFDALLESLFNVIVECFYEAIESGGAMS